MRAVSSLCPGNIVAEYSDPGSGRNACARVLMLADATDVRLNFNEYLRQSNSDAGRRSDE